MKISTMDRDGAFKAWCDDPNGTHVPLPLDVSQVSDAVVERVAVVMCDAEDDYVAVAGFDGQTRTQEDRMAAILRAALAALAAALGEEG